MTSLIQDLRSALEGTRELSDRVLLAMGWAKNIGAGYDEWCSPDRQQKFIASHGNKLPERPHPTRSLDDVPALMLEGWFLCVLCDVHTPIRFHGDQHEFEHYHAALQHKSGGRLQIGYSTASRPIAVCIALLEAKEEDDG